MAAAPSARGNQRPEQSERNGSDTEPVIEGGSVIAAVQPHPIPSDPARLLSVEEVAMLLGMSTAWVRQHSNGLRQPSIPSVKLGKSVRFRREKVLQFIEAMERCA
jgi:excisionase family DNA binding protein